MPVRAVVPGADGGVFVIVVLATLVVGLSVVPPVREVRLQSLREGQSTFRNGEEEEKETSTVLTANEAPTNTRLIETPSSG